MGEVDEPGRRVQVWCHFPAPWAAGSGLILAEADGNQTPETATGAPCQTAIRMEIVHLTAPGPVGGLETVVAALTAATSGRGHRVRLFALLETDGSGCPGFEGLAGVELVEVRLPPRRYRAEAERLRGEWQSRRPDLVHTHGYHADLVGWWAARRLGIPLVSTVHGFTGGDLKNRLYERLDRWALRRFDAVVAVSRPLATSLIEQGIDRQRVHVIPNRRPPNLPFSSEESRRRLGLPERARLVGWIGRMSREKGADVMIEAMPQVPADVQLVFLGEGPLRPGLARRVAELGLRDRVHFLGPVSGADRLLRAFDLVALSSRTEGTPMVLLEAIDAGVPIVATAVGGVPELLSDREALLVPPERPDRLAAAITECLDRSGEAARRAELARARLAGESPEGWVLAHETLYRSLV